MHGSIKKPGHDADTIRRYAARARPGGNPCSAAGSARRLGVMGQWLSALALLGAAAALSDCGAAPVESPPSTAGFASSPCGACTMDRCRADILECQKLPSCAGYLSCLGRCQAAATGEAEPGCEQLCVQAAGGDASASIAALTKCRTAGPGLLCSSCGRSPPPLSGDALFNQICAPSPLTDECDRCRAERCCQSDELCKTDPDCSTILKCADACPDGSTRDYCVAKCMVQTPKGTAIASLRSTCREALCSRPCAAKRKEPEEVCVACMARECPDILVAQRANPKCLLSIFCETVCDPMKCSCDAKQCRQMYMCPSLETCFGIFELAVSCQRSRCATHCLR